MSQECSAALAHALNLARHGLPCFPCLASKAPACTRGFKDATNDMRSLRAMWSRTPGPLVGVPTGECSGLAVIDIDPRNAGELWFHAYDQKLPRTRWHETRSGGLHLLFEHREGLRCSAGKIAPGVDVRGAGGFIVWWPCAGFRVFHPQYLAPWPDWLKPREARSQFAQGRVQVPSKSLLGKLARLVASASEGQRNSLTFWAACRAGEMVASGRMDAGYAAAVIAEAGIRAGLSPAEAERTADSGVRRTGGSYAQPR